MRTIGVLGANIVCWETAMYRSCPGSIRYFLHSQPPLGKMCELNSCNATAVNAQVHK
jgi:hypothetical protein